MFQVCQVVKVQLDLCQGNSMPLRGEGVVLQQLFNISQRSASLYNRAISGTRKTQTEAGGSDCLKEIWIMVIPVSLSLVTPYISLSWIPSGKLT